MLLKRNTNETLEIKNIIIRMKEEGSMKNNFQRIGTKTKIKNTKEKIIS